MSDRVNEAIEAAKKAADHHCAKHRIKDCEEIRQEAYLIAMEEIRAHPDAPTNHIAQRVKCGLIDAYRKERRRKGIALDEWRVEGGRDAAQTLEEEKERKLFLLALKNALSFFDADQRVIIERRVVIGEKLRDLKGVTAARAIALRDAFRERFRLELEEIKRVGDKFDFFNEFMEDDADAFFYGLESIGADGVACEEDDGKPQITARALRTRAKQNLKKTSQRETLRDLLKTIPRVGETTHVISSGKFNFWTFVPVIHGIINQPIDALYCATWMVNAQSVKELVQLLDAGIVRESRWIVGNYLKTREPLIYSQLKTELETKGRGWVKAMETHIKLILIESPPFYLTVTGSANMTENKRLEGCQLTNDRDTFEFYKIVLEEAKGN